MDPIDLVDEKGNPLDQDPTMILETYKDHTSKFKRTIYKSIVDWRVKVSTSRTYLVNLLRSKDIEPSDVAFTKLYQEHTDDLAIYRYMLFTNIKNISAEKTVSKVYDDTLEYYEKLMDKYKIRENMRNLENLLEMKLSNLLKHIS